MLKLFSTCSYLILGIQRNYFLHPGYTICVAFVVDCASVFILSAHLTESSDVTSRRNRAQKIHAFFACQRSRPKIITRVRPFLFRIFHLFALIQHGRLFQATWSDCRHHGTKISRGSRSFLSGKVTCGHRGGVRGTHTTEFSTVLHGVFVIVSWSCATVSVENHERKKTTACLNRAPPLPNKQRGGRNEKSVPQCMSCVSLVTHHFVSIKLLIRARSIIPLVKALRPFRRRSRPRLPRKLANLQYPWWNRMTPR